jgi:DNA-binding transcriptional ArsR family regulator
VASDDRQAGAYEYVPLDELDDATVRVAISPFGTAFVHTLDALTNGGLGRRLERDRAAASSAPWRDAARSRLRPSDVETLGPLVDPRTLAWPSCISPPTSLTTMRDAFEHLAELDGDVLAAAIVEDSATDRRALEAWTPVLRAPQLWLRRYLQAMGRAWLGLEPMWQRSAGILERETERVAAATARRATAELLDALHPYSSIADGQWRLLECAQPVEQRLRRGTLTVAPLLAASVCFTDDDDAGSLLSLSYPVPGAWRALDDRAPPPASLEALVGARRAALLRALDAPVTAGALADRLWLVPSGVTHHVHALESAGLVARERQGSSVLVRRTARGTDLLALYEP